MTDALLPQDCEPELLNFPAYTADQMRRILQSRVEKFEVVKEDGSIAPLFAPSALHLCCNKVSNVSGDIRKALDLCRAALEVVDHSGAARSVGITEMNIAIRANAENTTSATTANIKPLPVHQQLVLIACVRLCNMQGIKSMKVEQVWKAYRKVCGDSGLQASSRTEFHDLCGSLDAAGLVVRARQPGGQHRVTVKATTDTLRAALTSTPVLLRMLEDECLGLMDV
eukprot:CAMPEP_0177672074 /NCGR_PEP_ID=MMETSP0447-20121125/25107_1 /TAXON_ID=0 /ORGANISM="Stygamoeba regulata, Strain BSH-02190019" /LENGTH=225 /DNA_ID=CAMNT_0019179637 /DNA_START=45 /DNA_END=722 /DNA_ORIENTATION=+